MTAFYNILNSSPDVDGYFEIPGKLTGMFTPGFQFVAVDNYGGSPVVTAATNFTTLSSIVSGGNTRVTPNVAIAAPVGTWVTMVGGGYSIDYSDPGSGSITIAVGAFDGTTSLNLPGRAVFNYGEVIAQNFLSLLENFAHTTQPTNPTEGQLWYDKTGPGAIKVYDGATFVNLALSGASLPDLSDVDNNATSGASVGDVLTWTGADWDSQTPVGTEDGVDFDYVIAGATQVINTTNVSTTSKTGTTSYQQVFRNGILQREDIAGFPQGGNYRVTGPNQITFNGSLVINNEILIYAL